MATITLPAQVRSGTITTPSATWPSGTQFADLALILPVQAERDDPANHIDVRIDFSKDGGTTWDAAVMAGWNGGSGRFVGGVFNPPPTVQVTGPKATALVRATFILSAPMMVGVLVTTT